ncbi:hypothetical protein Tco_0309001 [Tanacetum coccineum]
MPVDKLSALPLTGIDVLVSPVEVKHGEWALKVVPWIGGRIHWLRSWIEISGYKEYSGIEYRSAGCTEEYVVIDRDLTKVGQIDSLKMEDDVGDGLAIQRNISILKDNPKVLKIDDCLP